jgi:hypothetical protein
VSLEAKDATMTLNLSRREMDVLERLAEVSDLSKTQVMRQALRLYQHVQVAASRGEYIRIGERNMLFVGPGFEDGAEPALAAPRTGGAP